MGIVSISDYLIIWHLVQIHVIQQYNWYWWVPLVIEILIELVLQVNDLETVISDGFFPLVYWNISNDIPGVLVRHVQWLSMSGMLDML